MARRSDHNREELTNLAVQSGLSLLDEKGLEAFSARAVAARMGYTVGTLYHVFGDLENYMLRLNGLILDLWYADIVKSKNLTVKKLALDYLAFSQKFPQRFAALFNRTGTGRIIPDWYDEKLTRFFQLIDDALPASTDSHADRRYNAKMLWAAVHGICALNFSGKLDVVDAGKPEKLIADIVARLS